ncbi:MAG: polysaccharide biosynthesis C-terminal domain-containing protein [Clostridia bacterium]|nr:polysaccharide biosynthesis C-terminal domain-containing protein [Clostridia bacterium]
MGRVKSFLMSAALLAGVNIFLRCIALSFNAYVSAKIGSESMGLFTLVMSVYGLSVTFATSGVNLAAVRLTAERTAFLVDSCAESAAYKRTVRSVMIACSLYSLMFGMTTGILLWFASPFVGGYLLGDIRTVLSLRVLALSLPAISLTSALSGCFTGLRKVYKNALSSLIEQSAKIILISGALCVGVPILTDRVEYACLAVVGGGAVSEGLSLIVNVVMYAFDSKRPAGCAKGKNKYRITATHVRDTAAVSLPVALGAYARQGLSTAEHLMIPWSLKKSGLSDSSALSVYGVLHGMVFPMILFPSAVVSSAAGLLIPELAELHALGKKREEQSVMRTSLGCCAMFSVGCAALFLFFGDELGTALYRSKDAGRMIRLCAPLVPVMYTDMVVDCVLKGIGEQLASMRINIIDSFLSLVFVVILVPRWGIKGYIVSVYVCEILNFFLSFSRLRRVTGIDIGIPQLIIRPCFLCLFALCVSKLVLILFPTQSGRAPLIFSLLYLIFSGIFTHSSLKRKKVC